MLKQKFPDKLMTSGASAEISGVYRIGQHLVLSNYPAPLPQDAPADRLHFCDNMVVTLLGIFPCVCVCDMFQFTDIGV